MMRESIFNFRFFFLCISLIAFFFSFFFVTKNSLHYNRVQIFATNAFGSLRPLWVYNQRSTNTIQRKEQYVVQCIKHFDIEILIITYYICWRPSGADHTERY